MDTIRHMVATLLADDSRAVVVLTGVALLCLALLALGTVTSVLIGVAQLIV